jgi:hypothetical protein
VPLSSTVWRSETMDSSWTSKLCRQLVTQCGCVPYQVGRSMIVSCSTGVFCKSDPLPRTQRVHLPCPASCSHDYGCCCCCYLQHWLRITFSGSSCCAPERSGSVGITQFSASAMDWIIWGFISGQGKKFSLTQNTQTQSGAH